MFATSVAVEVEVVAAVESSESFGLVLHGVRVYNVHDYGYAQSVCVIDKVFEVFGCSETAGGGEEIRHVVAERAVVGVLLYGHNLYGVVAVGGYARQNLGAEFLVSAHAFAFLGHAYVALIYEQGFGVGGEFVVFPFIGCCRFPYLSREYFGVRVLHHAVGVCRNAFGFATGPFHNHFIKLSVADGLGRYAYFPYTAVEFFESEFGSLFPVGEISNQSYGGSVGCPFAENPFFAVAMKSKIFVGVGEVGKRLAVDGQVGEFPNIILVSSVDSVGIWFEPGVVFDNGQYSGFACRRFAARLFILIVGFHTLMLVFGV